MKRILALSIFASVALGLLSGCGNISSKASPEAYGRAIKARTQELVATNNQYYGTSGYLGSINPQQYTGVSYPQLWQVLVNHLLGLLSQPNFQFTAEAYVDYVTQVTRFIIVMTRPWDPAWGLGTWYAGTGSFDFSNNSSILQAAFLGNPNYFLSSPSTSTWFATYLGGTYGGGP